MISLLIRRSKAEIRTSYYRDKEEDTRKEENCNMDRDSMPIEDTCIQPHDPKEQQCQLDLGVMAICAAECVSLNYL